MGAHQLPVLEWQGACVSIVGCLAAAAGMEVQNVPLRISLPWLCS